MFCNCVWVFIFGCKCIHIGLGASCLDDMSVNESTTVALDTEGGTCFSVWVSWTETDNHISCFRTLFNCMQMSIMRCTCVRMCVCMRACVILGICFPFLLYCRSLLLRFTTSSSTISSLTQCYPTSSAAPWNWPRTATTTSSSKVCSTEKQIVLTIMLDGGYCVCLWPWRQHFH